MNSAGKSLKKAVFLDRDGTLIIERNYLSSPDQVEILPGVIEGLKQLADAGYLLVIVTNQSGVGRGYFTLERVAEVHDRMFALLGLDRSFFTGVYVCPHAPDQHCTCRKPLPELALRAADEHGIDMAQSWMIGDKPADINLARAAGTRAILVRTGYGLENESHPCVAEAAALVADDMGHAAKLILAQPHSDKA
ncbi:MAG: D-glycero-alpha-D-manno-heptose-1,7-bisphosphate 7-phosphatase [bacterium]